MKWRTQERLFDIAQILWLVLVNVLGFLALVAAIAFGVLIALHLSGCSSTAPELANSCDIADRDAHPRGYCAYTDPR